MQKQSSLTLLDILYKVECMKRCLPGKVWQVLWSTSQELRKLASQQICSVQIRHVSAISDLLRHNWPLLTTLNLRNCNLGAVHITQLIKADLPDLQVLNLSRNPLTPAAVEQLVQGDWQSLTWLNLADSDWREAETIAAVVCCQHLADSDWPALTALNLRKNSLSAAALAQLVKADWPILQELQISFNQLQRGTGFMHQLAQAPWTALQELNISSNMLGVKDAMQLGRLGCKQLTRLNIARCFRHLEAADVTQAMRHFAAGEWPELKALNVSDNSLSSEAIAELANGAWPELQSLDASFNELQHDYDEWQHQLEGRPGFVQALGMASWTALQHLNLSCNALIAEDAQFLGQLDWPQLKSLDVRDCFRASGRCKVSAMPNFAASDWPQLTTLDVCENLFGETIMCDMLRGARLDYLKLGGNEVVSWARSVSPGWDHLGSLDLQGSPLSPEDICTLLGSCSHAFNTLHISCQVDWPTQARPSASSWPPCSLGHDHPSFCCCIRQPFLRALASTISELEKKQGGSCFAVDDS